MTRSDITFGTLPVLGELHRPDKSALLAEGAFFFLGSPATASFSICRPREAAFFFSSLGYYFSCLLLSKWLSRS